MENHWILEIFMFGAKHEISDPETKLILLEKYLVSYFFLLIKYKHILCMK